MECASFMDALIKMMCSYFIFDISYSKSLHPILIFIQRYILGIEDKQRVPNVVTQVLASLDQHEDSEERHEHPYPEERHEHPHPED